MSVWLQRPPGDLSAYEVDTDQPGHDTEDGGDYQDDGDVDQQTERPLYHVRNFKRSLEPDDREVDERTSQLPTPCDGSLPEGVGPSLF